MIFSWLEKRRSARRIVELERQMVGKSLVVGYWIETLDEAPPAHMRAAIAWESILLRLRSIGVRTMKANKSIAPLALRTRSWSEKLCVDHSFDPPRKFQAVLLGNWCRQFEDEVRPYHELRLLAYDSEGNAISPEHQHLQVDCSSDEGNEIDLIERLGYEYILSLLLKVSEKTDEARQTANQLQRRPLGIL
jgi:hypothetical protein